MTRATACMMRGQWQEGLAYHPLSPLILVALLILVAVTLQPISVRERVLPLLEVAEAKTGYSLWAILALFGYGVWRMVSD